MSPLWKWPRRKRQTTTAAPAFSGAASAEDKLRYVIAGTNGVRTLTVFLPDGHTWSFPHDHPNYLPAQELADKGSTDSEEFRKLFDVESRVRDLFGVITDRVRVAEGVVYFDEKPVENAVTDQILRFMEEGRKDFKPLAKFMEEVEENPNEQSRKALFEWIEKHDLAIDEDGWVVGFKGVNSDYTPTRTGPGIVNGIEVKAGEKIKYLPGNLVSIPREKVDETLTHCSVGLHVGTRSFADTFIGHKSPKVVEVRFSPRDVVSVDQDDRQKIRVCRLRVVGDAPPASHFNKALRVGV